MADSPSPDRTGETSVTEPAGLADEDVVDEDTLVEEVSIDGMCGVY
jgi:mycofactocin precursor